MNKFINTATGGLPFKHDDLRWNDDAYRNAFNGLLKAFNLGSNTNFIVSGCVATITPGVSCVVTAGYIFLNAELLQVDAQTIAYSGSNEYKYTKASSFDSSGDRTLKNTGGTVQTYQKNRGVVSSGAASGTELSVEGDRYETKIALAIDFDKADFVPVSTREVPIIAPIVPAGATLNNVIAYAKRVNGIINVNTKFTYAYSGGQVNPEFYIGAVTAPSSIGQFLTAVIDGGSLLLGEVVGGTPLRVKILGTIPGTSATLHIYGTLIDS